LAGSLLFLRTWLVAKKSWVVHMATYSTKRGASTVEAKVSASSIWLQNGDCNCILGVEWGRTGWRSWVVQLGGAAGLRCVGPAEEKLDACAKCIF